MSSDEERLPINVGEGKDELKKKPKKPKTMVSQAKLRRWQLVTGLFALISIICIISIGVLSSMVAEESSNSPEPITSPTPTPTPIPSPSSSSSIVSPSSFPTSSPSSFPTTSPSSAPTLSANFFRR
eukprot:TRINITY_DN4366_c0_g1_i1.p1 TRINITY_DN4366_c0_g1~~TRINITY_DN4366_c0_g1_i1.p1  ORF type:complete len:147 (+),score=66.14 TRINITY_DN4366_c0_g1_i1:66-443(+)